MPGDNNVKSLCFVGMDFCIQLVGAFTFPAITFEIIQYMKQGSIDNKISHVLMQLLRKNPKHKSSILSVAFFCKQRFQSQSVISSATWFSWMIWTLIFMTGELEGFMRISSFTFLVLAAVHNNYLGCLRDLYFYIFLKETSLSVLSRPSFSASTFDGHCCL